MQTLLFLLVQIFLIICDDEFDLATFRDVGRLIP
jgi:hypothetical protein